MLMTLIQTWRKAGAGCAFKFVHSRELLRLLDVGSTLD
jgi:hypothetical protein